MSGNCEAFQLRQEDVMKLLACQTHVAANNVDYQMDQYVYKRRQDGIHIINLRRTWEKLVLAARAIAAIENPADVCVISARPYGQRAILKFAAHTGATAFAGRFTPGTFTNQIQKAFREPRLLVITDPRTDHQAVTEASYVNIPVVALCNTDSPLKLIDIAIPCNNKGPRSIGLLWWMLAREVLTIKGKINRATGFILDDKEIMPDLYFYRDPEEAEKEEETGEPRREDAVDDRTWQTDAPHAPTGQMTNWQGEEGATAAANLNQFGMPDASQPLDWAKETQQWSQQQMTGGDTWGGATDAKW